MVDEQYKQKDSIQETKCPNWTYYHSYGYITNNKRRTCGNSVWKEGEIVTVQVDFDKGIVSWLVDKAVRATAKNEMLMDKKITWVPYF